MDWTLGLYGRVMLIVVPPFVRWLLSDRGMKPAGVEALQRKGGPLLTAGKSQARPGLSL